MRGFPPRYIANYDSTSAMVRANARFLRGKDFPSLGVPAVGARRLLPALNRLPARARELFLAASGPSEAISPRNTHRVDGEKLARWAAELYPRRRYPAIAIGSSNGALMHLWCAMQIPWLPQTYLVPVRQTNVHPDEPRRGMEEGIEPGYRLLEANPDLQLHHMHDANQDRAMLHGMTYFRVKRRRLGPSYEAFIDDALAPGGTIFIVDCRRRWPTTRLAPRHIFQHGALGGATQDEFLYGSERVKAYLERYGSHVRRWDSPEPNGETPEAEWGFEGALAEDIERFARERGYQVVRIVFEEPEDPSPLVADLYRWWYRRRGLKARRLLIESFILHEPYWALRTGSVPFWMKFNVDGSAARVERYLDATEPYDFIHMMLFSHGIDCVGITPIDDWREVLARAAREGRFVGVDPEAFPRDIGSIERYHRDLKRVPSRYPMPGPLTIGSLAQFLDAFGDAYALQWQEQVRPSAPHRPRAA